MNATIVPPASGRWRRRAGAALLVGAVLALHALVVQRWPATPEPVAGATPVTPLEVRALSAAPPDAVPAQPPTTPVAVATRPPAAAATPAAPPRAVPGGVAQRPPAPVAHEAAAASVVADVGSVVGAPATAAAAADAGAIAVATEPPPSDAAPAAPVAEAAPRWTDPPDAGRDAGGAFINTAAAADPGLEVPVYATRLPAPFRWRYQLRRGLLGGTAVLEWRRQDGSYRLTLDGTVASVPLLEWVSAGRIDGAGIAPDRFVMTQVGRASRAANFQRASGRITYSGNEADEALVPGTQDRLSWLVQLAGVLAAAPERYGVPRAQVVMPVSGVRGDLSVWQLAVAGLQSVDTPSGRVQAIALRREARKPFDTRGEVWMDPQRQYLPVKLRLSTIGRAGEVVDALTLELEATSR